MGEREAALDAPSRNKHNLSRSLMNPEALHARLLVKLFAELRIEEELLRVDRAVRRSKGQREGGGRRGEGAYSSCFNFASSPPPSYPSIVAIRS